MSARDYSRAAPPRYSSDSALALLAHARDLGSLRHAVIYRSQKESVRPELVAEGVAQALDPCESAANLLALALEWRSA